MYMYMPMYLTSISSSSKSPWTASTPLDAHQDGSMSAPSFGKNYDTRDKLWANICSERIFFLAKSMTPRQYRRKQNKIIL